MVDLTIARLEVSCNGGWQSGRRICFSQSTQDDYLEWMMNPIIISEREKSLVEKTKTNRTSNPQRKSGKTKAAKSCLIFHLTIKNKNVLIKILTLGYSLTSTCPATHTRPSDQDSATPSTPHRDLQEDTEDTAKKSKGLSQSLHAKNHTETTLHSYQKSWHPNAIPKGGLEDQLSAKTTKSDVGPVETRQSRWRWC